MEVIQKLLMASTPYIRHNLQRPFRSSLLLNTYNCTSCYLFPE